MEAVFVMSIVLWIVISICYLSMYAHDQTVLESLGKNYLELSVENGKDWKEAEVAVQLKKYLQEHLLICDIKDVSVEKKILSVEAGIQFGVRVRFPFVEKLLTGNEGKRIYISHEVIFPPYYLWDSEVISDVVKKGRSEAQKGE